MAFPETMAARWRAAPEDAGTGELRGFADLSRRFAFLEQQTDNWSGRDVCPSAAES